MEKEITGKEVIELIGIDEFNSRFNTALKHITKFYLANPSETKGTTMLLYDNMWMEFGWIKLIDGLLDVFLHTSIIFDGEITDNILDRINEYKRKSTIFNTTKS
jgi:hypothetical protein